MGVIWLPASAGLAALPPVLDPQTLTLAGHWSGAVQRRAGCWQRAPRSGAQHHCLLNRVATLLIDQRAEGRNQ